MRTYKLSLLLLTLLLMACSSITPSEEAMAPPAPQPPAEETPVKERDEIMDIVNGLSLEQKIGQMIIAGVAPGSDHAEKLISHQHVGGIILFRRNYNNVPDLINLVNTLHGLNHTSAIPLFMSIDEEGGTVSRLPAEATKMPDARLFGQVDDPELTLRAAEIVGKELNALGINLNFAPVVDVYMPGTNFLQHRSYGSDTELVTRHGISFMRGLQSEGVLGVFKHFPGHGATPVDSHYNLPVIQADLATLWSRELAPFSEAISAGAEAIMVGHLVMPALDPSGLPATRSSKVMTQLLRETMGFDGLIVTDDLEMLAYSADTSFENAIVETVKGGADLLIIAHNYDRQLAALNAIYNAVQTGEIPLEHIDRSVRRIVAAKHKYPITQTPISTEVATTIVGCETHREVQREVLLRSGN